MGASAGGGGEAHAGGGKPPVILVRRAGKHLAAAMRERFRVLDFFKSGEPLTAFLATAAAAPEPPRAAVVASGCGVRVDASFLDAIPSLCCVVSTAAGLDHIDLAECARRGVAVTNSGEVYSTDVADCAVGLLLDVLQKLSASGRYVRRGSWPVQGDCPIPLGSKLADKRVGIIGLGNIGSRIARRLQAFGCIIHYNSRKPNNSVSYKYFPNVHDLAAESDVLVVACTLNEVTRHIVNKDVLEALGRDGVLINVGRGANVDEAEMVIALKDGKIAGAGLDVFQHEPEVPAELFSMENVVLSPHAAVCTHESRSDLHAHTIGNLVAFFSGQPLLSPLRADSLVQ